MAEDLNLRQLACVAGAKRGGGRGEGGGWRGKGGGGRGEGEREKGKERLL